MNRLTIRKSDGAWDVPLRNDDGAYIPSQEIIDRLAAYEDSGLEPEEVRGIKTAYDEVQIPYEVVAAGADAARVIRLLDADDEGRLVVLPCKVGDTVYIVDRGEILEEKVIGFCTFNKKSGETVTAMTTSYGHNKGRVFKLPQKGGKGTGRYSYDIDDPIEVQKETVGQYTGLTDKNGKRIFEGDVVEYREYGNLAVASDWAKRWKACGLFNKETNHKNVIRLVGAERGQPAEPIEGQIGLEMTNNG